GDHQALDGDSSLVQQHTALSHFQLNRLHGFGFALAQVDIGLLVAHFDLERVIAHGDLHVPVALCDRNLLVALLHGLGAIVLNLDGLVVADFQVVVVLHHAVKILLRMEIDVFAALLVFQAQLVEIVRPALQAAAALDAALGFVVGKLVGRHLVGIVHAADDNGLVGIALEEIDDHFLTNAGDVNHAPLLAGPGSAYAHPAGAIGIVLALTVPVELYFHAAVLVREDFFPRGTDYGRGVRAVHKRLRG